MRKEVVERARLWPLLPMLRTCAGVPAHPACRSICEGVREHVPAVAEAWESGHGWGAPLATHLLTGSNEAGGPPPCSLWWEIQMARSNEDPRSRPGEQPLVPVQRCFNSSQREQQIHYQPIVLHFGTEEISKQKWGKKLFRADVKTPQFPEKG